MQYHLGVVHNTIVPDAGATRPPRDGVRQRVRMQCSRVVPHGIADSRLVKRLVGLGSSTHVSGGEWVRGSSTCVKHYHGHVQRGNALERDTHLAQHLYIVGIEQMAGDGGTNTTGHDGREGLEEGAGGRGRRQCAKIVVGVRHIDARLGLELCQRDHEHCHEHG